MKTIKGTIGMILFLCVVAGAGAVIWYLVHEVWCYFRCLPPAVAASVIVASGTIIVSVASVLIAKRLEQRAAIQLQLREKKIPVYNKLIKIIFRITYAEKNGEEPPTEEELIKFFTQYVEEFVVWASDDVVKSFIKFRMNSILAESDSEESPVARHGVVFDIENLLLEIRKDLGHSNKGLSKGKLLSLWINDVENYLK